jgi:ABC-2 type transport system ATP-binding protein
VTAALETTALSKRYGRAWALRDCTLSIPSGRVAAVVGPNGAGKTTLMRLAVGLHRIGFVGQETPLYRDLSVADHLEMGRRLNGDAWDGTSAIGRLSKLSIPLERRAGELSGGQRAQVALTIALAKRPDLLVLDEPVASLDPLARRTFLSRARVQVLGDVDDLLESHRVLIGPATSEPPGTVVVSSHESGRQRTIVVQSDQPIDAPEWTVEPISLEDLVLAYLSEPESGHLPGPRGRA